MRQLLKRIGQWPIVLVGCFVFLTTFLAPSTVQAEGTRATIHIGTVLDGPSILDDSYELAIREEIRILLGDEYAVRFEDRHSLEGDWTANTIDIAFQQLFADDEVDLVIALGVLSAHRACCINPAPKPVLAVPVIDPNLQGLPLTLDDAGNEVSGVTNLAYVALADETIDEMRAFQSVTPVRRVAFIGETAIYELLPEAIGKLIDEAASVGIEPVLIPATDNADEIFAALDAFDTDEAVDGVYLWPLYRFSGAEQIRLAEGLIERGLPSFVAIGDRVLDAGLLASRRTDDTMQRFARRVALNVQRIVLGQDAGTIPVRLDDRPQLIINMATASALGIEPRWETLLEAKLMNVEEARADVERLDLFNAVTLAIDANLDLAVERQIIRAGKQDIAIARSALLPQLDLSASAVQIDDDRAAASFGAQAETTWQAALALEQLVYSDAARANVAVQKLSQEAREAAFESTRLDIALDAATTYLELLRAETLLRVQRNNLDLTRSNLDLAELRVRVGSASRAEVYRWEAQIAQDRQSLVTAAAALQQLRIVLNRLLHRDLEQDFETVDIGLNDEVLMAAPKRVETFIATPERFRLMRDFTVDFGLERAPELAALRANAAARERLAETARRAFYLPTVAGSLSITETLDRSGDGSETSSAGLGSLTGGTAADDTDWTLAVQATLPLLTGGQRRAEQVQAEEELLRARLELDAATEGQEATIRAAMVLARASYIQIELSQESAVAVRKSLELVTDAYSRGTASFIDLLDTQTQALNAELNAANALYDFFIDLLNVERAAGGFYLLQDDAERSDYVEELSRRMVGAGFPSWEPSAPQ